MGNIVVLVVILAVLAAASYKIYDEKKKGAKCVGCPYAKADGSSPCSCNVK